MSLSIGIVGLPNVGKSTLFNALLKRQAALAANYPFATIEPNVGVVDVPDLRLAKLAQYVRTDYGQRLGDRELPEKIIPSVIKFYDIAGLVKGASQGEGLGNEFLSHIRDVDAIVQVVRDFHDENIIRAGAVDPKSDIDTINTELILADLQVLQKRLEKSKDSAQKKDLYTKLDSALNSGQLASSLSLTADELALCQDLNLLTLKPMIYVLNVDEDSLSKAVTQETRVAAVADINVIPISAKIESELSSFSDEEKGSYMREVGITESGLDKVIRKGYEMLGLQDFLTMGPKEVRAWTIKKGTKAQQAAGKIHTDFEKAFIAADIISFETLARLESWKKAKELGQIRLEGKDYVMQDGDVVEFRVNA
jgi:GTP-binding protein YchF